MANETQYSSCHMDLSASGIHFGSTFSCYLTSHTLMSVRQKNCFQYAKRMFLLFCVIVKQWLSDLHNEICLPYLDDVIIFSRSFEEHIEDVRKVLQRMGKNRIKLKASKCSFFKQQIKFLGWIVSAEGYTLDPNYTKAVTSLKDKP